MGRSSYPPVIHHDGHKHPLYLFPLSSAACCAACGNATSAVARGSYTCTPCGYALHVPCASLPASVPHPSHPPHELRLIFSPAYPEGYFECDACGASGNGFCYHCSDCSVDLHPLCALLPATFLHPSHFHPLSLEYASPYGDEGYDCDVCGSAGVAGKWLYRCSLACGFDAHLGCIVVEAPERGMRFRQAQPARMPEHLAGSGRPRLGELNNSQKPQTVVMGVPPANRISSGAQVFAKTMLQSAAQGLVEGAAQQLGQTLVQNVLGIGENGGGGGGQDSAQGEPSVVNVYCNFALDEASNGVVYSSQYEEATYEDPDY